MTTMTTKSKTGRDLTIRYGWIAEDKIIWADGHEVTVPETRFELDLTIEGVGKVECARAQRHKGAPAIQGEMMHQGKRHPVIVQIDTEIYNAIEDELHKGLKIGRYAEKGVKVTRRPELCPRCGTYCYGDCEAN